MSLRILEGLCVTRPIEQIIEKCVVRRSIYSQSGVGEVLPRSLHASVFMPQSLLQAHGPALAALHEFAVGCARAAGRTRCADPALVEALTRAGEGISHIGGSRA